MDILYNAVNGRHECTDCSYINHPMSLCVNGPDPDNALLVLPESHYIWQQVREG
jgi:hypothetical protein